MLGAAGRLGDRDHGSRESVQRTGASATTHPNGLGSGNPPAGATLLDPGASLSRWTVTALTVARLVVAQE